MKLRKLESLIKKNKVLRLYDYGPIQWMGDGKCLFPLEGLPFIEGIEILYTLLDIDEKKQEKISFDRLPVPEGVSLEDNSKEDELLEAAKFTLQHAGQEYIPMFCPPEIYPHEVIFMEDDYLGPVSDVTECREFYLRQTSAGAPYIAVKSGMVLVGIIFPMLALPDYVLEDVQKVAQLSSWIQK